MLSFKEKVEVYLSSKDELLSRLMNEWLCQVEKNYKKFQLYKVSLA